MSMPKINNNKLIARFQDFRQKFQTPDVNHEENWIRLVMLAYVQLWAAKDLATHLLRPWERYLKPHNDSIVTPSVVQRDFQTIISDTGKPGHSPKPRGN